jgi:hypothetical protein
VHVLGVTQPHATGDVSTHHDQLHPRT